MVNFQVYLSHRKPKLVSKLPENVEQVSGIQSINGNSILLQDGMDLCANALLFCTGYSYKYPFLEKSKLIKISEDERVMSLYYHMIHTAYPTLSFIGIPQFICPFPFFDCQTRFILATLDGSLELPSREDMDAVEEQDFKKRLESGMPARHCHRMFERQSEYLDMLADEAKFPRLKPVICKLFNSVYSEGRYNLTDFRMINYAFTDDFTFQKV